MIRKITFAGLKVPRSEMLGLTTPAVAQDPKDGCVSPYPDRDYAFARCDWCGAEEWADWNADDPEGPFEEKLGWVLVGNHRWTNDGLRSASVLQTFCSHKCRYARGAA